MNRLGVLLALALGACEPCGVSFAYDASGHINITGEAPADLAVGLCTSATSDPANAGACDPVDIATNDAYDVHVAAEGGAVGACTFVRRFLVVTGTGCAPAAVELVGSDPNAPNAPVGPIVMDLDVTCTTNPGT